MLILNGPKLSQEKGNFTGWDDYWQLTGEMTNAYSSDLMEPVPFWNKAMCGGQFDGALVGDWVYVLENVKSFTIYYQDTEGSNENELGYLFDVYWMAAPDEVYFGDGP